MKNEIIIDLLNSSPFQRLQVAYDYEKLGWCKIEHDSCASQGENVKIYFNNELIATLEPVFFHNPQQQYSKYKIGWRVNPE